MRLGAFLLLDELGRGGMGAVYRALDESLNRIVALKVMKEEFGQDKQFIANFLAEARAAAALNHPNVVQIYSTGEEYGQSFIVMEYISGGRLDEEIARGDPMDEERVLEIAIDVAAGLKAAKEIGLIHGDIKPANILFDKHGTAKVVDFGLARFLQEQQEQVPGEIWGTPYYIAPEKVRQEKVDHRADIYSLGATLYHALGARPPFEGTTSADVVLERLKKPAIGLRVIRPELQPETADVIARMLEADPFMRYPTHESLLADLHEAMDVVKQEKGAARAAQRTTHVGLWLAGAAILGCGAIVLAVMLADKNKQTAPEPARSPPGVSNPSPGDEVALVPPPEPELLDPPPLANMPDAVEEKIQLAFVKLSNGHALAADELLQNAHNEAPELSVGSNWIRLLQGVPSWMAGRELTARFFLKDLEELRFDADQYSGPHPYGLLKSFSAFMQDRLDASGLYEAVRVWPEWTYHLADFFVGLKLLGNGQVTLALAKLNSYSQMDTNASPLWVQSMIPLVDAVKGQHEDWQALQNDVSENIEQSQFDEARRLLSDFEQRAYAFLADEINKTSAEVTKQIAKEEERKKAEQQAAHNQAVQQDMKILEEKRVQLRSLLAKREFLKAAAQMRTIQTDMQTQEGREACAAVRDAYERMDEVKKFLIGYISEHPIPAGFDGDLGGDVYAADLTGLRVRLQYGEVVKEWHQVKGRLVVKMSSYALGRLSMDAKEKAGLYLSLSVFCDYSGATASAQKYASLAVQMDTDLEDELRRLLPGLTLKAAVESK